MTDGLGPYPAYRESGSPWLGRVPEHWQVRRLKSAVANETDQTTEKQPGECYVALEHVESWTGRVRPVHEGKPFTGQVKRFAGGDVLFGKLRPYLAKVARLPSAGVCSGEFFVLRPYTGELDTAYLELLLCSPAVIDLVNGSTFGAKMPRADWAFVGTLPVPLPPPAEQGQIVRFLAHAGAAVGRLMGAKRRLVGLLAEQKQAIIQRAVTGGLDPTADRVPSGVPWLGDIPAGWQVLRAKHVFREVDERSAAGSEELLSVSHYTGVTPRSQKNVTMFKAESYAGHKLCRAGDLVVNTMWAWMGALGVSEQTGIVSPAYGVYRPHETRNEPWYFDSLLRSRPYTDEYMRRSTGLRASRLRLYADQFLDIPVLLPPPDVQRGLRDRVKAETATLDAALRRAERELALLAEYRTTLTAAVVTGQLDVRAAADRLPDAVEPPPDPDPPAADDPDAEE